MEEFDKLRALMALPPVSQLGVLVNDVDRAVTYYASLFGIGPFMIYEFSPEKVWLWEKPSHMKNKYGKAIWGDIELELIEPLEGESIYDEFLKDHGEGIQHLGFNVADYDEMVHRFEEAHFIPLMRVESYVDAYRGDLRCCSFDTRRVGGIVFEIIWKSWLMGT